MLDQFADSLIWLYTANRKTLRLRGAYRLLKIASGFLPKLRHYPISFQSSGIHYADVQQPDTYWLLNAFIGDAHASLSHLARLLSERSKPGAVVWDIGGSMGLFTIGMLQSAPHLGSVQVFEPNPVPMKVASDLLGKLPKVKLHPFALGEQAGTATLFDGDEGSGTGGSSLSLSKAKTSGIEVQVKTGDSLVADGILSAPDIVKIDVEGFEPNVLRGMREIIAEKMPVIAMEILFLPLDRIHEIIPSGYKIRYIRESDGQLCEDYNVAQPGGCMDALLEPDKPKIN
jgi:FkbM family methyltransferase